MRNAKTMLRREFVLNVKVKKNNNNINFSLKLVSFV